MIAHSFIILLMWILSIFIPFIAISDEKHTDDKKYEKDTHFMRG